MAKWWVINKESLAMVAVGDDAFKASCAIGDNQAWVEVPEGVAPGVLKAQNVDGVISLVADSDKASPLWAKLRRNREVFLLASDWTQLADSPLSSEVKAAWATYRQALRDITGTTADPELVTWPSQP